MSTDQDGFTIIETLIALVIISITLLISAQTISLATRSEVVASERRDTIAAHRAILASEYQHFHCRDQLRPGTFERYQWTMESTSLSGPIEAYRETCFIVIEIKTTKRSTKFLHFRAEVVE